MVSRDHYLSGPVYLRNGKIVPAPPQYEAGDELYLAPPARQVTIDMRG